MPKRCQGFACASVPRAYLGINEIGHKLKESNITDFRGIIE